MAPKALESSQSHARILSPQPARADPRNLLNVVTAFGPVLVNHCRGSLQCKLVAIALVGALQHQANILHLVISAAYNSDIMADVTFSH